MLRWPRLLRSVQLVVGGLITLTLLTAAIGAPWLAPHPPDRMHPENRHEGPSSRFILGTDNFGRDLFSRLIWGARISVGIGLVSVCTASLTGTAVGLLAGMGGNRADWILMRVMDVVFAFPSILLALIIMGVLGSSLTNLAIAISVVYVPVFARIIRGESLSIKSRAFVEAAQAVGAPFLHILRRHVLPNLIPLVLIQMTMNLALAILAESTLSYLGLGTQPPTPSWGRMLSEGRAYLALSPWPSIFSGVFLMVTVIGFNLLGDGLRDVLDPRLKR